MPDRRAKNALAVALIMLVMVLAVSCKKGRPSLDSSRLDLRMTGARSPEEIENMIRASLLEKYSLTNILEGYTMYRVTNGPARWVFVQAANAPRGLSMFNLYCYERKGPDLWMLTGYVPVYTGSFSNSDGWNLKFQFDNQYVNAVFHGMVIFTTKMDKKALPVP